MDAGQQWRHMAGVKPPADKDLAAVAEDDHVIVVIDNFTGEVRQCRDHSGYCVGMNPWKAAGVVASVPVKVLSHMSADRAGDGSEAPSLVVQLAN